MEKIEVILEESHPLGKYVFGGIMRLISHRGNINGPDYENENKPEYVLKAVTSIVLPTVLSSVPVTISLVPTT